MTSKQLIQQSLAEATNIRHNTEKHFIDLAEEKLNRKPDSDSWSASECFQHLLLTNESYLKSFKNLLGGKQFGSQNSDPFNQSFIHPFKHSFLGKFILHFVNPKTKMKSNTTKTFNPSHSKVEADVVRKFLLQHDQLVQMISAMINYNLQEIKISSPINARIKYNLGDTIRIIILHDQRHIQQAERALK